MSEYSGYQISVEFSEGAIFGPHPEATENVDAAASVTNYAETLTAKLEQEFPGADVTVSKSINDRARVENWDLDVSASDIEHARRCVDEIIHRHWERWDWIVQR